MWLILTCAVQIHIAAPPQNVANTTNCYTELHNWTMPVPHVHTLRYTLFSLYIAYVFFGKLWFQWLCFFKLTQALHYVGNLQMHFLSMHCSFCHTLKTRWVFPYITSHQDQFIKSSNVSGSCVEMLYDFSKH